MLSIITKYEFCNGKTLFYKLMFVFVEVFV